ncbi:gustatory and pheromone receptor 39a-like [Daphnia pulicaria]|uniref:gustatory and pheromone receptor 39a-like n=1 Tax=Daphnia pulicaria TaxID=35523 RepID=UPI001EEA6F3F|nr:gustatory and pheromone receptor 39a-like [Daphnia pulicaria]
MKKFHFAYCQRNRGKIGRYFVFIGFVPILSHATVYQIYLISFAIFAKSAAFYGEIQQDVERKLKMKKENIGKWKRSLSLVDELVDRINECFGLILLVSIAHFSVEFIARSFYLVSSILRNQLYLIDIISMSSRIFLLWYFVCCPAKLHNDAVQVAISLRKIDHVDINLKNQISFLTADIIQSLPRISALGYFEVNAQLIPKLIGTTLTYLVILCQFQSSENG